MAYLFGALALVSIVVTVLPLVRTPRWWIRVWDYPRAQIAATAVVAAIGLLAIDSAGAWRWIVLLLLAGCIVYQLSLIYPYTRLRRLQSLDAEGAPRDRRLRILLVNVLMDNRNARDLVAMIERETPDLVLAVETDDWWDEQLRPLEQHLPHTCHEPLPNTYGLHFFSRLELGDPLIRHTVEPDIPSVRADVRLASGHWITFIGVHPKPPRPAQDVEERDAELVLVGREAKAAELPVIVAGDLNDVAWSHTTRLFQRISGLLDPRVGRGLYSTFHARIPVLRWPLDHLFHDPRFTLGDIRRLGYFGSDHFPVLVELALQPEAASHAERPRPEPGNHREARRTIRQVLPKLRQRMREMAARRPRLRRRRRRRQ